MENNPFIESSYFDWNNSKMAYTFPWLSDNPIENRYQSITKINLILENLGRAYFFSSNQYARIQCLSNDKGKR